MFWFINSSLSSITRWRHGAIILRGPLQEIWKSSFIATRQSCKRLLFAVLISTLISTTRIDHELRKTQTLRFASVGDSVVIHYTGYLGNGTIFDSSYQRDEPLTFVVGDGSVIRGFDDAVRGLYPGQSRRIRIEADRAYGKRSDDLVFSVAKHTLPSGIELHVGKRIPLSNDMNAIITEITEDNITLDANHHLAGETLTFDVELLSLADKVWDTSKVLGLPKSGLERAVFGLGCFWGKLESALHFVTGS